MRRQIRRCRSVQPRLLKNLLARHVRFQQHIHRPSLSQRRKPDLQQVRLKPAQLQIHRTKLTPRLRTGLRIHQTRLRTQHKVRLIERDLTKPRNAPLNLSPLGRTRELPLQFTVNHRMKQTSPDLLQQLLHGPVLQLVLRRLTDQQTRLRKIQKISQPQLIRMHQLTQLSSRHQLTVRVRNRGRQLDKSMPLTNHPPNYSRLRQKCRWLCQLQSTPQFLYSARSTRCDH